MQITAVYSESGGVTKTTTAVSLATEAARAGLNVVLIDLDPRGAATKWLDVAPVKPGLHIGAVLAAEDPEGWINDLAVAVSWTPNLRAVPSAREVSLREKESADHVEVRLKVALSGLDADLVVLDCPNRQGGPLILNALTAADSIIYATSLGEDGVDGVEGAVTTVGKYVKSRAQMGAPADLQEVGIVVGSLREVVMTRDSRNALENLDALYGPLVLRPLVPERVIVREARSAHSYFGDYPAGRVVAESYRAIAAQVFTAFPTEAA
jgi:cellulose biosynthesis protein BcsQ